MLYFKIYENTSKGNQVGEQRPQLLNEDELLKFAVEVCSDRLGYGYPKLKETFLSLGMNFIKMTQHHNPKGDRLILAPHPDTLKSKDPVEAHLADMPEDICNETQKWIRKLVELMKEKGNENP
jgi:hypothetical protein